MLEARKDLADCTESETFIDFRQKKKKKKKKNIFFLIEQHMLVFSHQFVICYLRSITKTKMPSFSLHA